jgi:hypothetical protein
MIDRNGKEFFTFTAIALLAAKGAAIGAAGYTASVGFSQGGFSNWSWGGFAKALAMGAVSGVASGGIGAMFRRKVTMQLKGMSQPERIAKEVRLFIDGFEKRFQHGSWADRKLLVRH